jgi:uncharacterized protein (TIGR03000 family)
MAMRTLAVRFALFLPVMLALGLPAQARAQTRAWGVGVGVGYGPAYGPYWGPGGGWGIFPTHYPGFYGNGLSMYGPPVPTYRPIPGVFGGGDSQFFGLPPLYRPGYNFAYIPLSKPAPLPAAIVDAPPLEELPPPKEEVTAGPLRVEIRVPTADARIFIDGTEVKGEGKVRQFATPELEAGREVRYDVRVEWTIRGLTTTHTQPVIGRAGGRVVVTVKE